MLKLTKLLLMVLVLVGLASCGQLHVREQKWIDRPIQKINQFSVAWLSNANGDWSGTTSSRLSPAGSFSGAGIPAAANELDFGKIGTYFKSEGKILLRSQDITGQIEAADSQKDLAKIVQVSTSQKYWLIFEAVQVRVISTQTGPLVFVAVTASLKDIKANKEIWSGKYELQAKNNLVDGRKFDAPMINDMLAAALKSISM